MFPTSVSDTPYSRRRRRDSAEAEERDAFGESSVQPPRSFSTRHKKHSRKKAVRTKSGCYTCRIRRKKCDEADNGNNPCSACRRLHLECLGYGEKRPEWIRQPGVVQQLRERIKNFLLTQGLTKGHSRSTRQTSPHGVLRLSPDDPAENNNGQSRSHHELSPNSFTDATNSTNTPETKWETRPVASLDTLDRDPSFNDYPDSDLYPDRPGFEPTGYASPDLNNPPQTLGFDYPPHQPHVVGQAHHYGYMHYSFYPDTTLP